MKKYNIIIVIVSLATVVFAEMARINSQDIFYGLQTWLPQSLGLVSVSVFVTSLILLFFRTEIFKSWLVFSVWFLPLSALFITLARENRNALDIVPDKEMAAMLMAGFYFFFSLIIIIVKSWKLRGK
jgi:hypothetical protein